MKFNVADLPAVQAQLERDTAQPPAALEPIVLPAPAESTYPAKRLALQDGRYHVVGHDK